MKKTVIIFILLALMLGLFACTAAPEETAVPTELTEPTQAPQPDDTQAVQTDVPVVSEPDDDYVRYIGGGINIPLEGGFIATTATDGYLVYTNGYLTVILSATDDYDAEMLAANGYDIDSITLEEYGSILIDTNELPQDCMFYDRFDNLCLSYSGKDSTGSDYISYSVIKKDEEDHRIWLIQFIGAPAVYEPYSVYFPEWADGILFR